MIVTLIVALFTLFSLIVRWSDVPLIFQGVIGVRHWVGIPIDMVEAVLTLLGVPGIVGHPAVITSGW